MKFGCGVSIFAFIFIILQLQDSEAVKCPYGSINPIRGDKGAEIIQLASGRKECENSCAAYICYNGISGSGCTDDFLADCSKSNEAIEFLQRKSLTDMQFSGYGVKYVSGCGNEKDGGKCLVEKLTDLYKELKANGQIDHMRSGQVYWNAEKNGKSSSSSDVVVPTSPSSGNANVPVSNKSDPPSRSYPRRNLSPRDE